ncbi:hypothetical protein ACWCPQ_28830 [Nocardia sp. NPDC001965]
MGWPDGLVPRVFSSSDAPGTIDFDGEHRSFRGPLDGGTPGRYIEVQVWSRDEPVLEEARRRFESGLPEDRTLVVEYRSPDRPDGPAAPRDRPD